MFAEVLAQVVIAVAAMLLLSIAVFVGRKRLATTRREWKSRLRTSAPIIVVLLSVLGLNRVMRQVGPAISREIGIHMTSTFHEIEGDFVLIFQRIATAELTTYFSLIYVYGYTFLLVFPVVAYFAMRETRTFRRLLTAYSINYAIGVTVYILVVAYGPRNTIPELLVGGTTVLYDNSPKYRYLTQEVNRNVNVFPSLHSSLAVTVAMFAYTTRKEYRAWFFLAVVLAGSVVTSTMYLGFHWGIDVVAGTVLAVFAVLASDRLVGHDRLVELWRPIDAKLAAVCRAIARRFAHR